MTAKRKITIVSCTVAFLVLLGWVLWSNTALEENTYKIESEDLPEAFTGFRVAQVSDLHNNEIGKNNERLLAMLRAAQPDMIAITGDLIDSRNTDVSIALQFAQAAIKIAPCYYVSGNHESRVSEYAALKDGLEELGVIILENEKLEIRRGKEKISVLGVADPAFETAYLFGDAASVIRKHLQTLRGDEGFSILLSHRPELMEVYTDYEMDLVLSGHAHGGQFRLPLLGGIYAPGQGFFPKYDSGLIESGDTKMIVSRGIGKSVIPVRFNNRPEVILVILESA